MLQSEKHKHTSMVLMMLYISFSQSDFQTLAEILTSNSVGTKLFFLGCNLDNNHGHNFITKMKICLVHTGKEISNHTLIEII